MRATVLLAAILIGGCSNQGMYEAMGQKHCMETTGKIYCEDDGTSYDDYEREREALLKD
jgi:hypothetical protein